MHGWHVGGRPTKLRKNKKHYHDQRAKPVDFQVEDQVFEHTPTLKSGPSHKLAEPFRGPYQVLATHPNGIKVVPVVSPRASPIRVALNQVRRCPKGVQVSGVDIVPAEPGGNLGQEDDESDAPSGSINQARSCKGPVIPVEDLSGATS